MNNVDAVVTKILGTPNFKYGKFFVEVEYECYGSIAQTQVMFNTEKEALDLRIGYIFLV